MTGSNVIPWDITEVILEPAYIGLLRQRGRQVRRKGFAEILGASVPAARADCSLGRAR